MSARTPSPIRVLLADDHQLFRESLKRLLETQAHITVVGEASNGGEALRLVSALDPDLLLLDFTIPVMPGLGVLRERAANAARVRTLLLVTHATDSEIVDAVELGA